MTSQRFTRLVGTIEDFEDYVASLISCEIQLSDNHVALELEKALIESLYTHFSHDVKEMGLIEMYCWEADFGKNPVTVQVGKNSYRLDSAASLWKALNKQ